MRYNLISIFAIYLVIADLKEKNISNSFADYSINFEWATKLNRHTLNIIGIWPSAPKSAYDRFSSDLRAILTFIFLIFYGAIPAIHSLVRSWGDMMSTIDNLQYTLPLLTAIMKLAVIWWKKAGKGLSRRRHSTVINPDDNFDLCSLFFAVTFHAVYSGHNNVPHFS